MHKPLAPYLAIAQRGMPFAAADGQAFVRFSNPSSGGFYFLPIRSRAFREWFYHEFYVQYDTLPDSRPFHATLIHLEAEATLTDPGVRYDVYRRVGSRDPGQLLVDLANPECQFVEITATGWKTTAGQGALLQTSRSTVSLPAPEPPSSPDPSSPPPDPSSPPPDPASPQPPDPAWQSLRAFLNLPSRPDWLRALAWLLTAFQPRGPYPILILQGPPGSGKSFAARILRFLIDPSTAPLTPIPSSVRDLLTLTRHNWILAFDHISSLSPQLTDALCRLSSGLGATLRETACSTPEPLHQYYKRPILLTVTDRWSCPADLAQRALILNLPALPPADSRVEGTLLDAFSDAWPRILAALCSALSTALARMPHLPPASGRCAHALAWGVAASPALGCTEEEMRQAFGVPTPPHPMVEAVRNLLEQRRQWTGTATQLLELLRPLVPCSTPRYLSQRLGACTLNLADSGIELKFRRLSAKERLIDLREDVCDEDPQKTPIPASQNLDPSPQPSETEELIAS